jgi:hypothetical protein
VNNLFFFFEDFHSLSQLQPSDGHTTYWPPLVMKIHNLIHLLRAEPQAQSAMFSELLKCFLYRIKLFQAMLDAQLDLGSKLFDDFLVSLT